MTNTTHTDERKMVQLSYFVSGCVLSTCMLIFIIFINWSMLKWPREKTLENSHCTLALKALFTRTQFRL